MSVLMQITLPYACAGIVIETIHPNAQVTRAAPIFNWMIGKQFCDIERWVVSKRGTIRKAGDEF